MNGVSIRHFLYFESCAHGSRILRWGFEPGISGLNVRGIVGVQCSQQVGNLAPRHGFEPRFTAPKAAVLPLDDRGIPRKELRFSVAFQRNDYPRKVCPRTPISTASSPSSASSNHPRISDPKLTST